MNEQTKISTELVIPEGPKLVALMTDEAKLAAFLKDLEVRTEQEVAGLDPANSKHRTQLKSAAHKIAKSKVAIEAKALELTEGWRAKTAEVNAGKKVVTDKLDALRDKTKAPAIAWEAADEIRKTAHREKLTAFDHDRSNWKMSTADINAVISEVEGVDAGYEWDEFSEMAAEAKENALAHHRDNLSTATAREEQAEEMARVKARTATLEAEAKERAERDAAAEIERKAAAEAAVKAQRDAEEAAAQAERDAKAKVEAEELAAKQEADRIAQAEKDLAAKVEGIASHIAAVVDGTIGGQPQPFGILLYELEIKIPAEIENTGVHKAGLTQLANVAITSVRQQMELAAERKAEDDAKAEAEKQAAAVEAERTRLAEIKAEEDRAAEKRANNARHRAKVLAEIKAAIAKIEKMGNGDVAQALMDGRIPHTTVTL